MIHYHGGVITEANEAVKFYQRRDVLISFAKKEKEHLIAEVCRSFVLDNGAFSLWKSGKQTDWDGLGS